ncbi:hypothetical protein RFI_18166 [Reticulomyxa filosa]|uniref:Uncharacterized protein n=1 Tax=Reticulomyxa filosa TaxID=46433 RepID=X6N166_RETFI|nr:hypothetical protein RFI_18166 [Reticulomyxa filosa]|eukprot:ETO19072.1 hypothetical protein RFI_18166 [Reticulomyxa filosa]
MSIGVPNVICVNDNVKISDTNAVKFAVYFYEQLFHYQSIFQSFENTKNATEFRDYHVECCCAHLHSSKCPHQQCCFHYNVSTTTTEKEEKTTCCRPDLPHEAEKKFELRTSATLRRKKAKDFNWRSGKWSSPEKPGSLLPHVDKSITIEQRRCDIYILINYLQPIRDDAQLQKLKLNDCFKDGFMKNYQSLYERQLEQLDSDIQLEERPVVVLLGERNSGKTHVALMAADFFSRNWWDTKFDGGIIYLNCKYIDSSIALADEIRYKHGTIRKSVISKRYDSLIEHNPKHVLVILDELHHVFDTLEHIRFQLNAIEHWLNSSHKGYVKLLLPMTNETFNMFKLAHKGDSSGQKNYVTYKLAPLTSLAVLDYWHSKICREKDEVHNIGHCLNDIRTTRKLLLRNSLQDEKVQSFLDICRHSVPLLSMFTDLPNDYFKCGYGIKPIANLCQTPNVEESLLLLFDTKKLSTECLNQIKELAQEFKNTQSQLQQPPVQKDLLEKKKKLDDLLSMLSRSVYFRLVWFKNMLLVCNPSLSLKATQALINVHFFSRTSQNDVNLTKNPSESAIVPQNEPKSTKYEDYLKECMACQRWNDSIEILKTMMNNDEYLQSATLLSLVLLAWKNSNHQISVEVVYKKKKIHESIRNFFFLVGGGEKKKLLEFLEKSNIILNQSLFSDMLSTCMYKHDLEGAKYIVLQWRARMEHFPVESFVQLLCDYNISNSNDPWRYNAWNEIAKQSPKAVCDEQEKARMIESGKEDPLNKEKEWNDSNQWIEHKLLSIQKYSNSFAQQAAIDELKELRHFIVTHCATEQDRERYSALLGIK